MSLINDMLRDLKDRQVAEFPAAASMPVPVASRHQSPVRQVLILSAVVAVLLLIVVLLWIAPATAPSVAQRMGSDGSSSEKVRLVIPKHEADADEAAEQKHRATETVVDTTTATAAGTEALAVLPATPLEIPDTVVDVTPAVGVTPAVDRPAATSAIVPQKTVSASVVRTELAPVPELQAYQRGLEALRQGDIVAATTSLQQALQIEPQLLPARLQLVAVLQQHSSPQAVEEVLRAGLQLAPQQTLLRKLYAQLLLQQRRYVEAIGVLEGAPMPAVEQDLEYHALRAGLLQEAGAYAAAAAIYTQLLQQRSHEALWWLGLAISLEQQGALNGAREAYQAALTAVGLRPELESFIRGRLQVL